MLSTADTELVQSDQAIAGMKIVVDPDAFVAALRIARPELDVTDVQLSSVHYRPTRFCVGVYQVGIKDATPLLSHVTAYSAKTWTKLPVSLDNHHSVLKERAVISIFPGDTRLTSLVRLMNRESRQDILKTLMPKTEMKGGDMELLSYKPERRYAGRIGFEDGTAVVLKHYRERDYHRSAVTAIDDCPGTGRLRTPCVVGQSPHYQSLVYEWLPGRLLRKEINTAPTADSLYASGAALAEFHTLSADGLRQRPRNMRVDGLNTNLAGIIQLHPPLAPLAQDLVTRITQKLSQETPQILRIHGDCNSNQFILMENGQVAIIDLDRNTRGNPQEDLGLFIAQIHRDENRKRITLSLAEPLIDALLEGYQFTAQKKITKDLHYHVAAGLFSLSGRPFRAREPDWPERTREMLERIDEILNSPYSTG